MQFKIKLTLSMFIDFAGCFVVEKGCKYLFADLEPKEIIQRGRERRDARRVVEEQERVAREAAEKAAEEEKKAQ